MKSISWSPRAHFVAAGTAYRLYEIDGFVDGDETQVIEDLDKLYGKSFTEGFAHKWKKNGTLIRLISGDKPLLSFTDDEVGDIAGDTMCSYNDERFGSK